MKTLTIILFLSRSINLFAQRNIDGHYRDYFGSRIQLNSDGTFEYTWHFDLQSSWTKGTWTIVNDTIFFHMIPVDDTLRYADSNNLIVNKLILSVDEQPEIRLSIDNSVLLSYGQNYQSYPDKLFFKKGKLYKILNGSLIKEKQKGFWVKKKWNPWYFKSDKKED